MNTFVPSGQPGGGTELLADIDTDGFSVSADGAHWGVLGELTPTQTLPKVFVYDGGVALLQGQPVPGLPGVTVTGSPYAPLTPPAHLRSVMARGGRA